MKALKKCIKIPILRSKVLPYDKKIMTKAKDTKIEQHQVEELNTKDMELENMLEEARRDAQEAEDGFTPLLNKIKSLETQLQEKEEIAKNSQIAYLHLKADFDILQRQSMQMTATAERDAVLKVVKDLIPFIENLRKSLLNLNEEQKTSTMGQGLQMMYENFLKSLEKFHVKPIEAVGLDPNPEFHEPISVQPTEDKKLKGKIIQEFEQGFVYENEDERMVISASKVIVGQ